MQQFESPVAAANWLKVQRVGVLRTDSRQVLPGDGFLAWPGAAVDARSHVAQALSRGATACLVEHAGADKFAFVDERIASFADLKQASAEIASAYFNTPSMALDILAVTGTNGKTSSAWWLAQALSNLELTSPIPTAFIGTLGMGAVPRVVSTGLTTPDPVTLQAALRGFVDAGFKACAIEASSIGIEEHRLDATRIHTAIFTNLTQDHLDYHGSMVAYGQAKAKLLAWPGLQAAVINVDDPFGASLAAQVTGKPGSAPDLWTVSMQPGTGNSARLQAQHVAHDRQGLRFTLVEGHQQVVLETTLMGEYNVSNLLGVIAAMRSLGVPLTQAVAACSHLTAVPGRMQCINLAHQPLVAVDYAHTPDALAKALTALRPVAQSRAGQLWCVFGCGGDRDTSKRPIMAAIADAHADRVVVTSDNPRSESPDTIISQILLGLAGGNEVQVEPDRARAIAQTLQQADAADVVLIAGKGHEDYQEIAGQRLPFSDLAQVQQVLASLHPALPLSTVAKALPKRPRMTLTQATAWLDQAHAVGWNPDTAHITIKRVHTDTRTIEPGDLFFALQGERFDANDFLLEAKRKGAVAAVCQGSTAADKLAQADLPGLLVKDSKLALAQLASQWRKQFHLPLIAVTGSNGKTTVTQMIASILRVAAADAALATQGNLNNDIGVPLTVLGLRDRHSMAVVELGMNHPGEIATLAAIAQPTIALVNNAQREHLEFMGSVQVVAQENGSVLAALPADGVAVFPLDDDFSAVWANKAGARQRLCFGAQAPVRVSQAKWVDAAWQVSAITPAGELHYSLHIAGEHNVKNSLAALACTLAAGVPLAAIAAGLEAFEPVKGRSRAMLVHCQGRDITVVDDTYNANPDSVRAAIEVLAALPGPRLLVLGDMGEVGHQGPQFHAEALQFALSKNIEKILVTGTESLRAAINFASVKGYAQTSDLINATLALLPEVTSVLIKGSRFMKMEQVVQCIVAQDENNCTLAPIKRGYAC